MLTCAMPNIRHQEETQWPWQGREALHAKAARVSKGGPTVSDSERRRFKIIQPMVSPPAPLVVRRGAQASNRKGVPPPAAPAAPRRQEAAARTLRREHFRHHHVLLTEVIQHGVVRADQLNIV